MSAVDPGVGQWLQAGALFTSASDALVAAAWPSLARETEIRSPLAFKAAAVAEAARQLAVLSGPLVFDAHVVEGLRAELIGQVVRISGSELDYGAGVVVFIIAAEEADAVELTTLTVLRRL